MKRSMLKRLLIALGFLAFGPVAADAQNAFVFPSGGGASLGGPTTTLGPADAASPVAQTLAVQSVVAGTSNTAGAISSFLDSTGTGTGASGGFSFKAHPAGSTGTAQNAAVTVFNIGQAATHPSAIAYSTQLMPPSGGSAFNTSIGTYGASAANQTTFQQGSAGIFYITQTNTALMALGQLGFAPNVNSVGDALFTRAAAATIRQGATDVDTNAAIVAQTFTTQGALAGGTADQAGKDFTIAVSPGKGTGAGGNLVLQTAPAGSTGTVVNALSQVAIVDSKSHIRVGNTTAPALTSCGTSPAIVGTDIAGTVTMGTTATGCVITFKTAYANAPICNVTWRATPLASQSYAISTTAITTTQTSASNNVLDYHCFAQNAG